VIAVGGTVGNYVVQEKIGEGAMGVVFLAVHPSIGKRVALKAIHPHLATNEEMLTRFFNEARAVTQIGHHHIVSVQDFGQTPEGDSFIVMELLEGPSLGRELKEGRALSLQRALHIARQIADGIAAAHTHGIIHRDLKPDNIILVERAGDRDFVKILDFGLAKLTGPSGMSNNTKTGSLIGTPHYMAPEQAEGKKIDARADVYSLGCMLFHMLTGRVPFPGEGYGEVLVKQLREPPPLPSRLNLLVPPSVEKIVLHALAKKPDFRFASMEAFRSALDDPARFERSMEAGAAMRMTPSEPIPAPTIAVIPQTQDAMRAVPMEAIEAPLKLPENAPTVQANAPPEVIAAIVEAKRAGKQKSPLARAQAPTMAGRIPEPEDDALDEVPRTRATRMLLGFVVGTLAFAAFGAVLLLRSGHKTVRVSVDSTPAGAQVSQGGTVLGTTPLVLPLPARGPAVELALTKDGYLEARRTVKPDDDQEVSVRLLPRPPVPIVTAPPVAAPAPAPPPAPSQKPRPVLKASHGSSAKPATAKPKKRPDRQIEINDQKIMEPTF
jgi:serine/threonine-protein kinase